MDCFFPFSDLDEFVIAISQVKMKGSKQVSALNQGRLEVHKGEIRVPIFQILHKWWGSDIPQCCHFL